MLTEVIELKLDWSQRGLCDNLEEWDGERGDRDIQEEEDMGISLVSSVAQSYPTLCDPMDCSTPGLPVHHQLLELAQTHVHRVGDAIQLSNPLSSPSPAFIISQLQGLS